MFQFKYFHIPKTLSRDYCTRVLQSLEKVIKKPQKGIINLIVVDENQMAKMNEKFRWKTGPTDILTFSYLEKMKNEEWRMKNEEIVSVIPDSWNASKAAWEMSGIQLNKLSRSETLKLSIIDSTSRSSHLAGMTDPVIWEIYLCLEKIKLYAKESWKTYKEQLEYIVIHGLVHLMGYDHETGEDAEKMEKIEKLVEYNKH